MKKVFLMLLVVTMCGAVKAQESKFGVRGGINLSNLSEKVEGGYATDYKTKVGYRFGFICDAGLSRSFYLQPGLYFTSLGAKLDVEDVTATVNLHYSQLPVLASFRIALSDRVKVHLNAGPYVSIGLAGKQKAEGIKVNAFSDEGGLDRFDWGLSFGAGIGINKFYFGLGYDLGLANILNDEIWDTDQVKCRNRNLHISVGFNF